MKRKYSNDLIEYEDIRQTKSYLYAYEITTGKVIACKDVINACNRFLSDIEKAKDENYPYVFDLAVASRIENAASLLKYTSGAKAGEFIDLAPPQAFVLDNLYGWRFKDNQRKRRFRSAFIMKGRKNAKTFDMSFIAIMSMLDEQEAEVVSVASKKDQSKLSFKQCRSLIGSNANLRKRFKLNNTEIIFIKNNSTFIPLASEEKSLDGTSPSTGIIDEAFVTPEGVRSSVSSGTGARLSPLVVGISTSYDVKMVGNWACQEMLYTKDVNAGKVENDRHFGVIYQLDAESEYTDERMWIKANPLIPYSPILLEDLQEAYKKSIGNPALIRNFKIKRMNLIMDGTGVHKYITLPAFERNIVSYVDFKDNYAFYGLDLSITTDLCAVTKMMYNEESGTFDTKVHAFLPLANIEELEARDGQPYRQYAEDGYITLIEGDVIEHETVFQWIKRDNEENGTKIAMVCYDPYNSDEIMEKCKAEGIQTLYIRQGYNMLSGVTKQFREYVYKGKIVCQFNPLMNWCVSNAITTKDKFNNEILDKVKSVEKIDLLASTIFAFLGCYKNKDVYYGRSYDDNII